MVHKAGDPGGRIACLSPVGPTREVGKSGSRGVGSREVGKSGVGKSGVGKPGVGKPGVGKSGSGSRENRLVTNEETRAARISTRERSQPCVFENRKAVNQTSRVSRQ